MSKSNPRSDQRGSNDARRLSAGHRVVAAAIESIPDAKSVTQFEELLVDVDPDGDADGGSGDDTNRPVRWRVNVAAAL